MDKAGLTTIFANGKGIIQKADGTVVLTGQNVNGMYLLDTLDNPPNPPIAMTSLSQPASLEQWHRRLTHCSPLTIRDMASKGLVDGLVVSDTSINGKCEDCIMGRQTHRPFDGVTEKDLAPLDLVAFDLWGPSRVPSAGGKNYMMIIVDGGTSYKYGIYLPNKSDKATIEAFEVFRTKAETTTGRKIRRMRTDRAYQSTAWEEYCQSHGITHEFTAPYSSAQNGLAERAIRTTIDDVRTLLRDSGLGHSYWAEAAAFSIDTRNLIPSRRHPDRIPTEAFSGKRQNVAYLRVFGSKCWAKIPTAQGASKLDPHSTECRLLGYASGSGNYKVQEVGSCRVFVSRDVVFEEGQPRRTSADVGEEMTLTFEMNTFDTNKVPSADNGHQQLPDQPTVDQIDNQRDIPAEPRRSNRIIQPTKTGLQSMEYKNREAEGKEMGQDWATNSKNPRASFVIDYPEDEDNIIACLADTKSSHHIPRSYKHAMATDPDRWMVPMQVEMDTLKAKHTWDLVRPPPGANVMDSMWVYDIKWDGEGNRIKDKARLVGKGYTQQLGIDYNETWAGVTRLKSVRMTAAVAA